MVESKAREPLVQISEMSKFGSEQTYSLVHIMTELEILFNRGVFFML